MHIALGSICTLYMHYTNKRMDMKCVSNCRAHCNNPYRMPHKCNTILQKCTAKYSSNQNSTAPSSTEIDTYTSSND